MGRGDFRTRTRESQKKIRDRKRRKELATELSRLEEGGKHSTGGIGGFGAQKHDKNTAVHKQRRKYLRSKLNIPASKDKMPKTTKPDGKPLESTTSGSKENQAKAQQKVIDSPEYKKGLKKRNKQQSNNIQTKEVKPGENKTTKAKVVKSKGSQETPKTKSRGAFSSVDNWSEKKLKKAIAAGGRNSVRKNRMRLALRKKGG